MLSLRIGLILAARRARQQKKSIPFPVPMIILPNSSQLDFRSEISEDQRPDQPGRDIFTFQWDMVQIAFNLGADVILTGNESGNGVLQINSSRSHNSHLNLFLF